MAKKNLFTPKHLPIAPTELEKEVKLIFFGPELSAEKFAVQFLFLTDGEWSLTPYLCHQYRDKELEEFASYLRSLAADEQLLDSLRKEHLSSENYDRLVEMELETHTDDEDDDEYAPVDIVKLRSSYFSNCVFPEELAWLVSYQNQNGGFVGNGIDIRDDEDLDDYNIKDTHRLFAFAADSNGAPIAVWNAGGDKFPVVYLNMGDPESCFVVADSMNEFLSILTLPLIAIDNLFDDYPIEWDEVNNELKSFRRKLKREFNISKPTNVQNRIKALQLEFDGFRIWCESIMQ